MKSQPSDQRHQPTETEERPELTDESLDQAAGGVEEVLRTGMDSQTQQIEVRGWDPAKKKAFIGKAEDD